MELFGDTKDFIRARWFHALERICPSKIEDPRDIPIIINSFNRLTTLRRLIASLEQRGLTNIHILDNCSTYPPLLEWYATGGGGYDIIRLPKNLGFKALWNHRPTPKRLQDRALDTPRRPARLLQAQGGGIEVREQQFHPSRR